MSKNAVITARLTPEAAAKLDALATRMERTRAWIISRAVERYVQEESEFLDFIQVGIDDLDNGRWISHEDLIREIDEKYAKKRAA